jgi:hypothetical protein
MIQTHTEPAPHRPCDRLPCEEIPDASAILCFVVAIILALVMLTGIAAFCWYQDNHGGPLDPITGQPFLQQQPAAGEMAVDR